jgi:hypothetical protein
LFARTEELRALFVGADAEDGLLAVRHGRDKMPQGNAEVKGKRRTAQASDRETRKKMKTTSSTIQSGRW